MFNIVRKLMLIIFYLLKFIWKKSLVVLKMFLKLRFIFFLVLFVLIWIYMLCKKGMILGLLRNENNIRFFWFYGKFNYFSSK